MVLAALALERIPVRVLSDGFQTQRRGSWIPGKRTCRKCLGECDLDCWKKGVDMHIVFRSECVDEMALLALLQ